MYCPSGARWEASKKSYAHALLQAVRDDLIQQGDVAAILAGDFNLQVEDSFLLRQWRFDGPFYDISTKAPPDIRDQPTCHHGTKGSKIDFVWVSRIAYDLVGTYSVSKLPLFKSHSVLRVSVRVPSSSQVRRTQRRVANVPVLAFPSDTSRLLRSPEDKSFQADLSAGRVSQAFNTWSKQAEQVLFQIAQQQGHQVDTAGCVGRGKIKFNDTRFFPSVKGEAATTMVDRKLYKALCRVQEVSKARAGHRRSLTWSNVSEVLPHLHSPYQEQLSALLQTPDGPQSSAAATVVLQRAIEQQAQFNRSQRLVAWKLQMRASVGNQSKWLAKRRRRQVLPVATDGRRATASLQGRAQIIRESWQRIYEAHKNGEPSFRGFLEAYGPNLQRGAVELPSLDGGMLRDKLRATSVSAPGMDKWDVADLKLLSVWAPNLFDRLARLLQVVEAQGVWPEALIHGSVCFIPKDLEDAIPTAMQHRPITVLSTIYRLWSSVRHDQLAKLWQPQWAPAGAYGFKGRPAADSLVFDTCAYLAGAAQESQVVGGISNKKEKCFDRVPVGLAVNILRARGCDNRVCKALDGFYSSHVQHFRLEGHYDEPLRPANGLVQGCPLSMLVLSSMVTCWHEHLQASLPGVVPKSYADDISACTKSTRPRQVRAQVVAVHTRTHTHQFVTRSGLN